MQANAFESNITNTDQHYHKHAAMPPHVVYSIYSYFFLPFVYQHEAFWKKHRPFLFSSATQYVHHPAEELTQRCSFPLGASTVGIAETTGQGERTNCNHTTGTSYIKAALEPLFPSFSSFLFPPDFFSR